MSHYSRIRRAIDKRRDFPPEFPPLGKRPAKFDSRNIRFSDILRVPLKKLPPIPDEYSIDVHLPNVMPTPMFANDQWGCCVIAARAHQTLRLEDFEQLAILDITDDDVLREYWDEQPALCKCFNPTPDKGLVLLDSLKSWRNDGWQAASKLYNIYAFAEIDALESSEVRAAIYLLMGAQCGILVPQSALDQFKAGQVWEVVPGSPIKGGHGIALVAYSSLGPCCVTWGKLQWMTWNFFETYCDEVYGIVDNRDEFLADSPVDVEKLDALLREITK